MEFVTALDIQDRNQGSSTGRNWTGSLEQDPLDITSPVDGRKIASVAQSSAEDYAQVVETAVAAFDFWRTVPAPRRGDTVRRIGQEVRALKQPLGRLISWEMGKSLQEGLGEVQEMIDICDFSVGQSRMLYGRSMHSERPGHRLYEQYHPLGPVGIVTAFNFPVAVWAWNAMIATVCGDVTLWKPSSRVPLSAIAMQKIIGRVIEEEGLPEGIFSLVIGPGGTLGEWLVADTRIPLISFTGSVASGRRAAQTVAARLGRTILELSGNNAIILSAHADLNLALPAIVFGSVGTAGQRCTTTRRLLVHETIYDKVRESLVHAYGSLRIGNPLDEANHMGPLIHRQAVAEFLGAMDTIRSEGGRVLCGGEMLGGKGYESGCYVTPAIVETDGRLPMLEKETFGPILYLIRYSGSVGQAIAIQNDVRQGLSSSIFTTDLREAEAFLSSSGSDCGIANVNLGTSGAEIGGAFGGEKDTGGGRESGSDAWKAYMRRQTVTINYGTELPLAQGIRFTVPGYPE